MELKHSKRLMQGYLWPQHRRILLDPKPKTVSEMAIDKKHISVSIDSSRDLAWRVEDEGSVLRRRF